MCADNSQADEPALINILPGAVTATDGIRLDAPNIPVKAPWQGLVCTLSTCDLFPYRLRIVEDAANPGAVSVSHVRTRRSKPGEVTLAVLVGLPELGKPIDTYFGAGTSLNALDESVGTIGVEFNVPGTGPMRIVPRWNNQTSDTFMTVYVEHKNQRQAVGVIPLEVLNESFRISDILIWAGDIDGDSKLDLITRNTPDSYAVSGEAPNAVLSNALHLWLSTRAQAGGMLGLAASQVNWECLADEGEGC